MAALTTAAVASPSIANAQDQFDNGAATASAQDDPAPSRDNVILVTAQKRSESINEVPLAIQAFGGEDLRQSGITEAQSLAVVTPALNVARSSANTPIYTLRGVGFNTPNLSSTSPVGVYYDEIAYAYPFMSSGPIFDIERVEVLKGPQGTLYGRNTTGGLVNFIVQKPDTTFGAGLNVEVGNYDTQNFEGYLNIAVSDTLAARFAGRIERSGRGWQKSISRDERLGEKDRVGLRGTLAWALSDRLTVDLVASYWKDQSDTVAGQAVLLNPDQPAFVDPRLRTAIRDDWTSTTADWDTLDGTKAPFKADSRFYGLAGRVRLDLSDDISLVSLTGYNDVSRNDQNDVDGTSVEVFAQQSVGDIQSFSQELRLEGSAGPVDYILGVYYSKDDITDNQIGNYDRSSVLQLLRFLSQNVIDPTNALYTPEQYATGFRSYRNTTEQRNRSKSVFASMDWELSDKLSVTVGARYTDDQLKFSACSGDFNGNTLPIWNTAVHFLVNVQTGNVPNFNVQPNGCMSYAANFTELASFKRPVLNEDNLAGRLSLQYQANPDLLIFGSFSRGYKSGAVPMLPTNVETQLAPATQERITAYELGTKATLVGGAVQLNGSVFYYDYKDKQLFSEVLDPVFTTLTRLVNVPKSEVYGGEVDLNVRVSDVVDFRLGASYTKTKITEFTGFDRSGQPADFVGSSFPYTPEWTLNAAVKVDQPVSQTLGLRGNVVANYQSSTAASLGDEPGFKVDAYTVVNASLDLYSSQDNWSVGLYANNLFNEYYWNSTDVLTDVVFRIPGAARTYGVRLGWSY
ncbi:hypothetical protein JI59_19960 (plasmid) [Novosphingobium pentaromativorans US6-1]|nr:hypothetical protein JI59_19960 [Novosphingobium pentaromativorans US6-1]